MVEQFASQSDFHVLIIGGGITGLLIAHGLQKAGIGFSIFETESQDQYRPREWSMMIHWSLSFMQELLPPELFARIKETQVDPTIPLAEDHVPMINGLTGNLIKYVDSPKAIRVSRRKTRKFCMQGLDIQYDKTLMDVSYGVDGSGVTATFKGGSTAKGSMIIGADGPSSSMRQLLVGPEAKLTPLDVNFIYINVCYKDPYKSRFVRCAHPTFSITLHPEVTCFIATQDVPDPHKPEDWLLGIILQWLGKPDPTLDDAGRLAQVKEKAKYLPQPCRSALEWLPSDTKVPANTLNFWLPTPWDGHGGRATLAGDAAHPMSPHRGQGLNHAICDAYNLVNAIKKVVGGEAKLEDVIEPYAEDSRKRGGDEVKASRQTAYEFLDWNRLMNNPLFKEGVDRKDLRSQVEGGAKAFAAAEDVRA